MCLLLPMKNMLKLRLCIMILALMSIDGLYASYAEQMEYEEAYADSDAAAMEFPYGQADSHIIALKTLMNADIEIVKAILHNNRLPEDDFVSLSIKEVLDEPCREAMNAIAEYMSVEAASSDSGVNHFAGVAHKLTQNDDENDDKAYEEHLKADARMLGNLVAQLQAIEVDSGIKENKNAQQVIKGFDEQLQATLLCNAIGVSDCSAVSWLINNGIAVNTSLVHDGLGLTPLMCAVRSDKFIIVSQLLSAGARVETTNALRHTALECAVDSIRLNAALALKGMPTGNDEHAATVFKESDSCKRMQQLIRNEALDKGPGQEWVGWTADAIVRTYHLIIQTLIAHGAPVKVIDEQGREKNIIDHVDPATREVMQKALELREAESSDDDEDDKKDGK